MNCRNCNQNVDMAGDGMFFCARCNRMLRPDEVYTLPQQAPPPPMPTGMPDVGAQVPPPPQPSGMQNMGAQVPPRQGGFQNHSQPSPFGQPMNGQQPYGQQGGYQNPYQNPTPIYQQYQQPKPVTNSSSALVCGILSVIFGMIACITIFALPGLCLGIVAVIQGKKAESPNPAAVILGIIGIVLSSIMLVVNVFWAFL